MYGALVVSQGWITWHARKIADGAVKKTIIQAYFWCFCATSFSLVLDHLYNDGTMSGGFFGTTKLIFFIGLSLGYGWFLFMQPPNVWAPLGRVA